jgi:hypothetical protein
MSSIIRGISSVTKGRMVLSSKAGYSNVGCVYNADSEIGNSESFEKRSEKCVNDEGDGRG